MAHRYMNVGTGNEAARFISGEYINRIFGIVWLAAWRDILPCKASPIQRYLENAGQPTAKQNPYFVEK